jgi:hypothetical protein
MDNKEKNKTGERGNDKRMQACWQCNFFFILNQRTKKRGQDSCFRKSTNICHEFLKNVYIYTPSINKYSSKVNIKNIFNMFGHHHHHHHLGGKSRQKTIT